MHIHSAQCECAWDALNLFKCAVLCPAYCASSSTCASTWRNCVEGTKFNRVAQRSAVMHSCAKSSAREEDVGGLALILSLEIAATAPISLPSAAVHMQCTHKSSQPLLSLSNPLLPMPTRSNCLDLANN